MRSLQEAFFSWIEHFFQAVERKWGEDHKNKLMHRVAKSINVGTLSTAFSGVDAPGTAMLMIRHCLGRLLHEEVPGMMLLSAIEWGNASQLESMNHPEPPQCLFSAISDFYQDGVREIIQTATRNQEPITYEMLKPVILSGKAMTLEAFCLVHQRLCKIKCSKCHVAGPPCVDWSRAGAHLRDAGRTTQHMMAWFGLRRALQEPLVGHENVLEFPDWIVKEMMGDLYFINEARMSGESLGWPAHRHRAIRACIHKEKVLEELQPWPVINQMFQRVREITWRELLVADAAELAGELEWASSRKGALGSAPDFANPTEFVKALTKFEQQNLKAYMDRWPGCCYMLAQDAKKQPARSNTQCLCTLIRNTHICMSSEHLRWFTAKELLVAQAFPAIPTLLVDSRPVTSFNIERAAKRKRVAMVQQAGNSMNVNMVGALLLYFLGFTIRADSIGAHLCGSSSS